MTGIKNLPPPGPVKIICEQDPKPWGKSFPPGGGRPPFFMGIIFDTGYASIYQRWQIEPYEEGYTIKNNGNGFWAYNMNDKEVDTSNVFDSTKCKWYIQSDGDGIFKILVPNKDLVWTIRKREPDYPLTVFLDPADGGENQIFSFELDPLGVQD